MEKTFCHRLKQTPLLYFTTFYVNICMPIEATKLHFTYCQTRGYILMRCAIWYHLCNLKNVKNTHGGVLLLVKSQAKACNFNKSNTPPWLFVTFFKLHKQYQIVQRITYSLMLTELLIYPKFLKNTSTAVHVLISGS